MIIIVESGSTKSDWVLLNGEEQTTFKTKGLNPYFHSELDVENAILQNESLVALKDQVTQIWFYGSGCSSPDLNAIIHRGLQSVFLKARINIDHDLNACAYATYNGSPSISCILGTGSNSCFFDGKSIHEEVPALGYILGDEGSGAYFGKKLIADFLYKKLPKSIADRLNEEGWNNKRFVNLVYQKPHANVFLASFMPIISNYKDEPYINDMMKMGFKHFIENHVMCYENFASTQVHFVGSVAYFFADTLTEVFKESGLILGNIIRHPVDGLILYHKQKIAS